MAENKKAVLRRIKAVKSTQQITKAMKMVDAAKLRRAQEKVISARPYARELAKTLARLVQSGAGVNHPLLQPRTGTPTVAYVVMTADRGLAGSYNVNIIRKAQTAFKEAAPRPLRLVAVGRKGRDFFTKRGVKPALEFTGFGDNITFALAHEMVGKVINLYLQGEVDEVRLIYTEFINPVTQRPKEVQLLPVVAPEGEPTQGGYMEYIYAPDAQKVLDTLVPRYVETLFYQALLEAKASEHGARMTAMGSATDNATDMINRLTLAYNRARQAAITKEISEIVGGANALNG